MTAEVTIGDSFLPLLDGTCREQFVAIEGPRGTGKTRAVLSIILARALRNPGSRWLLCRSTRTRLTETVLTTLEEQVFPAFGMPVPGGAGRENRHRYDLPNGSVMIPMGLDDPQRTQSLETAGVYVAEGVELDKVDDVLALAGSMRQAPQPSWDPRFFHQCFVDCNPGPPAHWLNQTAEETPKDMRRVNNLADYRRLLAWGRKAPPAGRWKRVITRHFDNPAYFDVVKWAWTKAGEAYLATLGHLKGHLRRRWLDGDWVAAEGTVYPEFNDEAHAIEPFEVPRDWPCILAEDPGYDHPTSIIVAALAPNERMYVVAEIVKRNTTVEADAIDIKRSILPNFSVKRMLGDPHYMFSRNKHNSGKTIAMQMREHDLRFIPAPAAGNQSEIAQQVEMVRTRLTTLGRDGRPMLQVFNSCPNVIRGFQSWSYERTSAGEIKGGEDRFEDVGDDEMDCVRMLAAFAPTYARYANARGE